MIRRLFNHQLVRPTVRGASLGARQLMEEQEAGASGHGSDSRSAPGREVKKAQRQFDFRKYGNEMHHLSAYINQKVNEF